MWAQGAIVAKSCHLRHLFSEYENQTNIARKRSRVVGERIREKPVVPLALRALATKTTRTWFKAGFKTWKEAYWEKQMWCENGIFVFKPETPLHGIISRSHFRSANRTKCHQDCFFTQRSQSDFDFQLLNRKLEISHFIDYEFNSMPSIIARQ